ncbi:hypothetical protein [Halobaculum limi]|uniref:hypothetical protein n=1 Tax=Halobaculum limi TaxID=3031916 RepID=UPI0024065B7B|nr:hypothetical protein [Halobaculum sp. YSMS11]
MSSDVTAADRRIVTQLGEARRIPLLNVREGDFGVLVGFPIAGLLVGSLLWNPLVLPLTLVGVIVGVATVYAAPRHRTAWGWLQDIGRYYLWRPRYTLSRPAGATHEGTDGGRTYAPFTPDERTQDLTNVARAWPGTGVIEREDGALEAFIEVTPANMDFAMSGDWEAVQRAGERFANGSLRFPLTVHTTTRAFPGNQLVERLTQRRADPDIVENEAFEALLAEYRERRPADLADTRQHRYYLGVGVQPSDLGRTRQGEPTPSERLADFPVFGMLLSPLISRRSTPTPARRRQELYDRLRERLRVVESEFIEHVDEWESRRLSTLELFVLTTTFWNGTEYDTAARLLAREPALATATRREEA